MAGLLTYKNYTRFVVEYLSGLLKAHADRIRGDSPKSGKLKVLNTDQFMQMFQTMLVTGQASIPRDMQSELVRLYPTIKAGFGERALDLI